MSAEIIALESRRRSEHFTIECMEEHVHVISVREILALAKGEAALDSISACLLRRIIAEWSGFVLDGR